MDHKLFKWISLITAILILSSGIFLAVLLWGIDIPSKQPETKNTPNTEQQSIEYSPELFPKIIAQELQKLGFSDGITFISTKDGQFIIDGTAVDANLAQSSIPPSLDTERFFSTPTGSNLKASGHIGMDEKGNGKFILDQISANETVLDAGVATELIESKTMLNKLIDVPFDEIETAQNGIVFCGEIPLFIRIALYTLREP